MSQRKASLQSNFRRVSRATFDGWVFDQRRPTRKFCVELLVDGLAVASAIADDFVQDLFDAGQSEASFGFTFSLPEDVIASSPVVEARLANLDEPIGSPIETSANEERTESNQIGALNWVGGLRFEGWVDPAHKAVQILVSEQVVSTVVPKGWAHVARGDLNQAVRRLDIHLPAHFADGRVKSLTAVSDGRTIAASIPFVAYSNGLEHTLAQLGRWDSERLRGRFLDALIPSSFPFYRYDDWKNAFMQPEPLQVNADLAVIIVGEDRLSETIESLETEENVLWTALGLPTSGVCTLDSSAAETFLTGEAAASQVVVFCLAGAIFRPDALARIADAFKRNPDCCCLYADLELQLKSGGTWPHALPALDRERVLEQGYPSYLFAMRRNYTLDIMRNCKSLYELFAASLNEDEPNRILHLPGPVASFPPIDAAIAGEELREATANFLRKRRVKARVDSRAGTEWPSVRITRSYAPTAKTAIIIPTRNRTELLARCIDSLLPVISDANVEVLVVDNGSNENAALDYLSSLRARGIRVISIPGPFNFSRLNNLAVEETEADNLCLMNNDIQAIDESWLAEMLSRLADPTVGAVGAKLLWPTGVVQHGGVVLGTNFAAAHAFNDRMQDDPGYGGLLQVAHECSALTAACLLLRRSDYLAVGGMDEVLFPINFNDVDLCLKLRQKGYRNVFAPDAVLVHLESASRGRDQSSDRKPRFERELMLLRAKWGETLLDDPYYSPILGLDSTPFSALAWPPRSFEARENRIPTPKQLSGGC